MTWNTFVIQELLPWIHCIGSAQCHGRCWKWWGCTHTCDCHKGWKGPEGDQRGVLQKKQCSSWSCSGKGNFRRLQEVPPHFDGKRRLTYFYFKDTINIHVICYKSYLWLKLLSQFVSISVSLFAWSSLCYLCWMRQLHDLN